MNNTNDNNLSAGDYIALSELRELKTYRHDVLVVLATKTEHIRKHLMECLHCKVSLDSLGYKSQSQLLADMHLLNKNVMLVLVAMEANTLGYINIDEIKNEYWANMELLNYDKSN